jgi:hypothetical protein
MREKRRLLSSFRVLVATSMDDSGLNPRWLPRDFASEVWTMKPIQQLDIVVFPKDPVGTLDFAVPVEHMRAIDLAMLDYFGTPNWVQERNHRFSGLSMLAHYSGAPEGTKS